MVCVYCSAPTQVVNSRHQRRNNDIWRRRKCTHCGSIFTAIESADLSGALRVAHTPQRLEPFLRDKLFVSIYDSCKHRPTALRDAGNLTQQIIARLLSTQDRPGLIHPDTIVNTSIDVLKRFDRAAATTYAAYHPLP
jgi:transcriptional regulator NrdR family protein